MAKTYQGNLNGAKLKAAIVVSRFNELITKKLLEGAQDRLTRQGVNANDIDVVWVPGAFEIPMAAQQLAKQKKYDAIICLGAIIKGETAHFDYIAGEAAKGVAQVALASGIPVVFGVITSETVEQAIERAGVKKGNKGSQAAESAIEMANLFKELK